MTTKFNIGDTVIDNEGIKGSVVRVAIDEFGIKYNIKRYGKEFILTEYEDNLTKAPITREEALTAALKDIGKRISMRIDAELSEREGCFEVWSKKHNGPYIEFSKTEYPYEKE